MNLLSITLIFCKRSYNLFLYYNWENDRILIADSDNANIPGIWNEKIGER